MDSEYERPPADEVATPQKRSGRNTGARAVIVALAVIVVVAGLWWIVDALG